MPSPMPTRRTEPEEMTWGAACDAILVGRHVRRLAWTGEHAEACLLLHANVVHLRNPDGSLHVLQVSDADLSATDWVVVRQH